MPQQFDRGYVAPPFRQLAETYPATEAYPHADFRTEWGPVFHRGRLDGTARVLIIGQDPAQHENIARRILVGEAGHRVQGLLAKLGMEHSYVMVNTYLYSARTSAAASAHRSNPKIATYRNAWLTALMTRKIEGVIALGSLADRAWALWRATPPGRLRNPAYARITHPTQPSRVGRPGSSERARATKALLDSWNSGIDAVAPRIRHRDRTGTPKPYGDDFREEELVAIPDHDLLAGTPAWMREYGEWAKRGAGSATGYRITITVPTEHR